jgi:hypothetical protein
MSGYGAASVDVVADLSRYVAEIRKLGDITDAEAIKAGLALEKRIATSSEKAAREAAKAAKAAAGAGGAIKGIGESVEKSMAQAAKAAALTGSALGSMAGPIGDIGDAFQLMSPQVAAATVAFAASVGVIYQLGSNAIETARNADKLSDSLGDGKTQALEAKAALEGMDQALADSATTIGVAFVPMVTQGADTITGLITVADQATDALGGVTGGYGLSDALWASTYAVDAMLPGLGTTIRGLSTIQGLLADIGAASRNEVVETTSTDPANMTPEEAARAKAMSDLLAKIEQDTTNNRIDELSKLAEARRRAGAETVKTARSTTAAVKDEFASFQVGVGEIFALTDAELSGLTGSIDLAMESVGQSITDQAAFAAERQAMIFDQAVKDARAYADQVEAANVAAVEAQQAASQAAYQQRVNDDMSFASYLQSSIGASLQAVAGLYDETTTQGKQALRELAAAQKVAAIFDIGIKTAQAIMSALTLGPILGPIAAAAMGIAGAVQAAAVAAMPPPTFHSGRYGASMANDVAATLLPREVVVPAPTVAANGGADGVRRALRGGGGGDGVTVLRLDLTDRTIRAPLVRDISRSMPRGTYPGWAS